MNPVSDRERGDDGSRASDMHRVLADRGVRGAKRTRPVIFNVTDQVLTTPKRHRSVEIDRCVNRVSSEFSAICN